MADELVVATVLSAEQQPGARAPALRLTLDLGTYGTAETVMAAGTYDEEQLVGMQLLCRRDADGAVGVAARSHASGDVPLVPQTDVEPGTLVD